MGVCLCVRACVRACECASVSVHFGGPWVDMCGSDPVAALV